MKKLLPSLCLFLLLVLVTGPVCVLAQSNQGEVPTSKVKDKFFSSFDRKEKVSLLESMDKGKQLTVFQLGAKYRWGYIPPDRKPPNSLARWWKSLSPRGKDNQRVKWFNEHYQELNLDRSARELGKQDELTKIYRRLEKEYVKETDKLESVPFPDEEVKPPRANASDTNYEPTYEQNAEGDEKTSDGNVPSAPQKPRSTNPSEDDTNNSETADADTDVQKQTASETTVKEFGSGSVTYKRVGDRIKVIGRDRNRSGRTDEGPKNNLDNRDSRDERMRNEDSPPTTEFTDSERPEEASQGSEVSIPPPMIRDSAEQGPRLRRYKEQ